MTTRAADRQISRPGAGQRSLTVAARNEAAFRAGPRGHPVRGRWSRAATAVLAVAVLIAGVAQVLVQLPTLGRLGFHFDYHWPAARQGVIQITRSMAPTMLGLAVTQINTFVDSLIAWGVRSILGLGV